MTCFSTPEKDQPNACIPHQRGSRFSGQRWRRAVRESAAGADQSLPPSCQSHASVRGGLTARRWHLGLIGCFLPFPPRQPEKKRLNFSFG